MFVHSSKARCPVLPSLDPPLEAHKVTIRVLTLHLGLEVGQQLGTVTILGLLAGKQRLEVCLPVKVGRHHEALAVGVGGGEEHEVAGELVVVVHPDDVADYNLLSAQGLQLTAAEDLNLAMINLTVTLMSAVVFVTLKKHKLNQQLSLFWLRQELKESQSVSVPSVTFCLEHSI